MKKRVFALFLALVLCLGILSLTALATGAGPSFWGGREPDKVITAGTNLSDVTTSTSPNYVAKNLSASCEYYLNGNVSRADTADFVAALAKRGSVAEFYLDVNGDIGAVKVYSYTADKVDGAVTTKTDADGTLQVQIPGVQYLTGWVDADKVEGWQGLEDGDVVLTYRTKLDTGYIYSYTIEKADKITGQVTSYTSAGTLIINGKNYRASEQATQYKGDATCDEDTFKTWMASGQTLTDEYDFYLDKNGSIVVIEQTGKSIGPSPSPSPLPSLSSLLDGYIFIIDGGWSMDNELADDDVYRINIVDTNGTVTTMRADAAIKEMVEAEASSALIATTGVIRNFWAIAELDENRTVSGLTDEEGLKVNHKPVTLSNVRSMGGDVITFANAEMNCDYDDNTKFVFVDMGWVDGDQANNMLGVVEATLDKWAVYESGTFDPENFFNIKEVSEDAEDGATYLWVHGTAIVPQNSTTADYVYVVRYLWPRPRYFNSSGSRPGTAQTGSMESESGESVSWSISQTGAVAIDVAATQLAPQEFILVGCYDSNGRFTGVKWLDAQHATAQIDPTTPNVKLFWLGAKQNPLSACATVWGE